MVCQCFIFECFDTTVGIIGDARKTGILIGILYLGIDVCKQDMIWTNIFACSV